MARWKVRVLSWPEARVRLGRNGRRGLRALLGLGAIGLRAGLTRGAPLAREAGGWAFTALGLILRAGRAITEEVAVRRDVKAAMAAAGHDDLMSRDRRGRRRGGEDELSALDDGVGAVRRRWELEIRAARDFEREEKRRFKRIDGAWRLAAVGAGLLAGGVAMDPLGGLAGVGLGILVGGAIGWLGTVVNGAVLSRASARTAEQVPARPQIAAPVVSDERLPQGRAELVQKLLADAATSLRALDAIIPRLRHPDSVASVARIVAAGNRLMTGVAADPDKLAIAQRVFTYYCPETVKVVEALAKLERDPNPDLDRIHGTQGVVKKLEMLFERTELEMKADESKALDIDLRLLDQSLESDLKTR